MADMPIITSMLNTDLYKLTMGQAVFRHYDRIDAGYVFINRGGTPFPPRFDRKLKQQLEMMADIQLQPDERRFLEERCGHYLRRSYIDWLSHFRYDPGAVVIRQRGGVLSIAYKGPMYKTIYWEVSLMATVSELYFCELGLEPDPKYIECAYEKGRRMKEGGVYFAEFGTRRRFSHHVHEEVVKALIESAGPSLIGTSNVYLAMKYGLTPIGTHAHEWFMLHAGLVGYRAATRESLRTWSTEFEGSLGTALTDTLTTNVFLNEFNAYYAKLFDGVRHDSGNPFAFTDKIVIHYQRNGIDPRSKRIVFSDGLNVDTVLKLQEYCHGKIGCLFGIGTNLTNDVGHQPLNIVIKMSYIIRPEEPERQIYVVKLSDEPNKVTGNRQVVAHAKIELGIL